MRRIQRVANQPLAHRSRPFINIKFESRPFTTGEAGNYRLNRWLPSGKNRKGCGMKRTVLALTTAITIGVTALAAPSPAEARWRGGGWGPGIAGGLIGAAIIGGIASSAYAYGPGYGGYYGSYPGYGYYGGYEPAYYGGYAPAYYGGYTTSYAPAYYGPRFRRVVRPAYAYYNGPRYHHRWHHRGHRHLR